MGQKNCPPPHGSEQDRNPSAENAAEPLRVLLVDDLELVRRALSLGLSAQDGLAVVGGAQDGAQALVLAQQLVPDVVLLDLCMPGPPTALTVSGLKALPHVPVVLALSARQDPEALRHALAAGADGYLSKAMPPDELADAIKQACDAAERRP
ncbi:response regulator [Fundidesulfovibrio butyratiphilus]